MQKKKKNFVKQLDRKFYKKNLQYRNKNHFYQQKNNIYYILGEKKPSKPLTTAYLHRNKKLKIGMFFKKPTLQTSLYPFHLNLKLINEYLKKK